MRLKFGLLFFPLAMLVPCFTRADYSIRQYTQFRKDTSMKLYVAGIADGYGWSNVVLNERHQAPLFCQPPKLALAPDNYIDMLDREINDPDSKYTLDTPIALVLFGALARTFPCRSPGLNP